MTHVAFYVATQLFRESRAWERLNNSLPGKDYTASEQIYIYKLLINIHLYVFPQ